MPPVARADTICWSRVAILIGGERAPLRPQAPPPLLARDRSGLRSAQIGRHGRGSWAHGRSDWGGGSGAPPPSPPPAPAPRSWRVIARVCCRLRFVRAVEVRGLMLVLIGGASAAPPPSPPTAL